jgi:hypothetical protein
VAPQALILMNNSFMRLHARRFAERLESESLGDTERLITLAFEHALSRQPTDSERAKAREFLGKDRDSLTDLCQTLFNLNEFVYIL